MQRHRWRRRVRLEVVGVEGEQVQVGQAPIQPARRAASVAVDGATSQGRRCRRGPDVDVIGRYPAEGSVRRDLLLPPPADLRSV